MERRHGFLDDVRILDVEVYPQSIRPAHPRDASVTQEHPEQIRIVLVAEHHRLGRAPAPRTGLSKRLGPRHVPRPAPVADGRARDADPARDLAVVEALLNEAEGLGSGL